MNLRLRYGSRVLGLAFLIFFLWVAYESQQMPRPLNPADVGPGEFPFLTAVCGSIASVLLAVFPGTRDDQIVFNYGKCVWAAVVIIVLYAVAIPYAGFYPASLLAIPALMLCGGIRSPVFLLLSSVGFSLVVYFGFQLGLNVLFP